MFQLPNQNNPSKRHKCRSELCPVLLEGKEQYCIKHKKTPQRKELEKKIANKDYDIHRRDKESTKFYQGKKWKALRNKKIKEDRICQYCNKALAKLVDHVLDIKTHPELKLTYDNLKSSCWSCHSRKHKNEGKKIYRYEP